MRKRLIYLLRIICFFLIQNTHAQKPANWVKHGDESTKEHDFYGASIYYSKALDMDASNIDVTYKYALSLKGYNEYEKARSYFALVIDMDKEDAYPEASFWYATMLKFNGEYDAARKQFKSYYKSTKLKSSYFGKKAKQEIKSCQFALKFSQDTTQTIVKNAGELLNSYDAEFGGTFQNDSTIIFSALKPDSISVLGAVYDDDYWINLHDAFLKDGQWEDNGPLDTVLNINGVHTANGSFSHDGNRFYYSRCDETYTCNIFVSLRLENKWEKGKALDEVNVAGATTTQPHIANVGDEEVLFFVSDRVKGKGQLDIWYSKVLNSGENYGRPKNLGSNVNSIDNEVSPFYDTKTKKLYFSSEWHFGLGGFDIFECSGSLNPKKPHNLGIPICSSANDIYYVVDTASGNGLLTSNRSGSFTKKGETCCNDIYEVKQPLMVKRDSIPNPRFATLEQLNKYLPVTLYFHNDRPNPKSLDTTTSLNYMETYHAYHELKETYDMEYSKELSPVDSTKAVQDIDSFFSDYVDQGVEDLELFSELLIKELEKGEKINLMIKGYASPLAKTDYNVNLTLRRISSMINFLSAYEGGVYLPYIDGTAHNGGKLIFTKIPFGEYNSETGVSDNFNDQRNSVYSRSAALERKIEILSALQIDNKEMYPEMTFVSEIHDFGKVVAGDTVKYVFKFTNTGQQELIIEDIETACRCTGVIFDETPVAPGKTGEFEISFDSSGKAGMQVKTITILSNSIIPTKVVQITAEVVDENRN